MMNKSLFALLSAAALLLLAGCASKQPDAPAHSDPAASVQTTQETTDEKTTAQTTQPAKSETTGQAGDSADEDKTLEDADIDGKNRYELPVIPLS